MAGPSKHSGWPTSSGEEAADNALEIASFLCSRAPRDVQPPPINIPEFTNLAVDYTDTATERSKNKKTALKTVVESRVAQSKSDKLPEEEMTKEAREADTNPIAVPSPQNKEKSDDDTGRSGSVGFPSSVGAILTEYATVTDIFRPQIFSKQSTSQLSGRYRGLNLRRQSPGSESLEVIRVWKGLSLGAAEAVLFWEHIFARVLLHWLDHNLGDIEQHWGTSRYIPVCLDKIMDDMLAIAQKKPQFRPTLMSVGASRKTLSQFIRTHEFFTLENCGRDNEAGRLVVGVKIWQPEPPRKPASAEVIWNTNYISFEDFDHDVVEGKEFRLVPKFVSVANADSPHYHVKYSTLSTWLHWCHELGAFVGVVPFYSDPKEKLLHPNPSIIRKAPMSSDDTYILQLRVKATVTERFEGTVRLEQTVSARVSLRVAKNSPPLAAEQQGSSSISAQGEEQTLPWPENRELTPFGITMEEYRDYQDQAHQLISQTTHPINSGFFNLTDGPPNVPGRDDLMTPESPFIVSHPFDVKDFEEGMNPNSLYFQMASREPN